MALIKPTTEQRKFIRKQMVTWAKLQKAAGRPLNTNEAHGVLYSVFADLGIGAQNTAGYRASRPSYTSLGMTRKAGEPTDEDREKYAIVTGGAELPAGSLVIQALFNDTDYIGDRHYAKSINALFDLHDRYLGRANDRNHSFNVNDAACRVIGLGMGTDPDIKLHPDTPVEAMKVLTPHSPVNGVYTALWATLAFPKLEGDDTIERVKLGLLKDISIAFRDAELLCSVCLTKYKEKRPMVHTACFTECEEHGFPGGLTDEGTRVVGIVNGVTDAFTFGIVSDGAIPRACMVLDPTIL